jgi:zinc-binding alcohol dehydrogenase family protein
MKAIGYYQPLPVADEAALLDIEAPTPPLRAHDILVRVEANSVNPVDIRTRAACRPQDGAAKVLGYDAAGIVEAVGSEVRRFRKGDAVFYAGAIDRPGANSELHAVDERIVGPKPKSLSFAEAAALPLTSLAAWELLFDRLRIPFGEPNGSDAILIVNGADGVGSIMTQIARRLTGLIVIATASRPESATWCRKMGAHHVIDHQMPLKEGLCQIGIPHVRYVAALSGTERHQAEIVEALCPHGALAIVDDPEAFDVVPFKSKSIAIHWESMFTRSTYATRDMCEQHCILSEVSSLVDGGVLHSTVCTNLGPINAANLRHAHAELESGRSIGKAVVSGWTSECAGAAQKPGMRRPMDSPVLALLDLSSIRTAQSS